MRRALAPSSQAAYSRVLERAFGALPPKDWRIGEAIRAWPNSSKALLRNAISRTYRQEGLDPSRLIREVPLDYQIERVVRIPGEDRALAFEEAAQRLAPPHRALALLPLKLGLRAAEVYGLERDEVESAHETGELIFVRKGGREAVLPCDNVRDLFGVLLAAPAAAPVYRKDRPAHEYRVRKWKTLGEVLSRGSANAQYRALWRLVKEVDPTLRPHLLRHAFATRMNRDGAPIPTIQAALGHKSWRTTERYVHANADDISKYMRR